MIDPELGIYPLVVIADRYSGTYSGGAFVAFNMEPSMVPCELFDEDDVAAEAWEVFKTENQNKFATGATVKEAINRLFEKIVSTETTYFN